MLLGGLLQFRQMIGQPEIDDLDILNAVLVTAGIAVLHGRDGGSCRLEHDHDVLGLQIPVNDLQGVEVLRGLDDLADDEGADVLREPLAFADVLVQVIAVDVLCDDVDVRLAADRLLVLHDLRVRDYLHDLALVVYARDRLRSQLLSGDVLQRETPAGLLLCAPVHDRELTYPDYLVRVV